MMCCTELYAPWQTYRDAHSEQSLDDQIEGFIAQENITDPNVWDTTGDFSLHSWLRLAAK